MWLSARSQHEQANILAKAQKGSLAVTAASRAWLFGSLTTPGHAAEKRPTAAKAAKTDLGGGRHGDGSSVCRRCNAWIPRCECGEPHTDWFGPQGKGCSPPGTAAAMSKKNSAERRRAEAILRRRAKSPDKSRCSSAASSFYSLAGEEDGYRQYQAASRVQAVHRGRHVRGARRRGGRASALVDRVAELEGRLRAVEGGTTEAKEVLVQAAPPVASASEALQLKWRDSGVVDAVEPELRASLVARVLDVADGTGGPVRVSTFTAPMPTPRDWRLPRDDFAETVINSGEHRRPRPQSRPANGVACDAMA